jgi:hypothetical protein
VKAPALAAHDAGLCVLPVAHDGTKRPDPPGSKWQRYQHERPTRDDLDAWMAHRDGFGIVCGATSGNLELFEIEGRAVDDGTYTRFVQALISAGLQELWDRICAGYFETSPAGGVHLLYRCEQISGNLKLARRPNGKDIDVLIETRGEGGFAVVAPSGGRCHETGEPWVRELGGFDTIATITPEERAELHRVAMTFDEMPSRENTSTLQNGSVTSNGDRPGDNYNANTTWADVLEPHGWECVRTDAENIAYWRRPGKTWGVSATTNSRGTDRLKVFSSSTPFDTETTYDRFGAYAVLEHGGDFAAAARALRPAPRHRDASQNGSDGDTATDKPDTDALWLPDTFWDARDRLRKIRDAAHQRQRSPDAALHVCLARVAAMVPYTLTIPAIVGAESGLSYYCALLSVPGVGKSTTLAIGSGLIPADAALVGPVPLGTGEGIVEIMFEKQTEGEDKGARRQTKHHVLVYGDEGGALQALASRSGSTIDSTLRTIWTGKEIGNTNATEERRRLVREHTYTYGLVLGVQVPAAGALLATVATGLPQRFGWALATHPDIPPATGAPRPLDPLGWKPPKCATLSIADEIIDEIRAADLERVRGRCDTAELDAHEDLLRLKAAVLLAILVEDTPFDSIDRPVTVEHWELAGMVKRASDAARSHAVAQAAAHAERVEDANARRLGRRQATAAEIAEAHELTKTVDAARWIAEKARERPAGWAWAELRRAMRSDSRRYFEPGVEHAEAEEWVVVSEEPGQGQTKRVIAPGPRRPA